MKTDPRTLTKWVKRLALPALLVACVVFFRTFWFAVVPTGMDTMPDSHPAGTICVIQRNPTEFTVGSIVFIEVQAGAAPLLARVRRVTPDHVFVAIDNPASAFAGYASQEHSRSKVTGLVLTKFESGPRDDPARSLPEHPRGK